MSIERVPNDLFANEELERDREEFIDGHRDELRAQIAVGVAQAERGELVDGDDAMERIRRELIARRAT